MNGRPKLQLTRRSVSGSAAPPPARPATPAHGRMAATFGASAPAAGPVGTAPSGPQSVAFPPPPGLAAGGGSAPMTGGVPLAMSAAPMADAPAAIPLEDQIDEIYEAVVERLRRDLLIERERMGDLVGDLLR